MRLREAARGVASELRAAGIPDPELEAEVLARNAAAVSRTAYFAGIEANAAEITTLHALLERRLGREPSAYITGSREFYGRDFAVGRGVLVPRPETELLVELGLEEVRRAATDLVVVDVGTGSGAVAVSIAAERPESIVVGIDVSGEAVRTAARNAGRHAPRTRLAQGDLLSAVGCADVVLANLPYVPSAEIEALEPEVSRWEPRVALDGGADGLDLIRRLVADCDRRVRPSLLALEVGFGQADAVSAELERCGRQPWIVKDLAGIDRVVCARWR